MLKHIKKEVDEYAKRNGKKDDGRSFDHILAFNLASRLRDYLYKEMGEYRENLPSLNCYYDEVESVAELAYREFLSVLKPYKNIALIWPPNKTIRN